MAWHAYRADVQIETIDFGKLVVAIVHIWPTR